MIFDFRCGKRPYNFKNRRFDFKSAQFDRKIVVLAGFRELNGVESEEFKVVSGGLCATVSC